jgi:hypothetical protein
VGQRFNGEKKMLAENFMPMKPFRTYWSEPFFQTQDSASDFYWLQVDGGRSAAPARATTYMLAA